MTPDNKHSVFISYAKEDSDWVKNNLISVLENNEIKCEYYEKENKPSNGTILERIIGMLDKSVKVIR